MTTWMRRPLCAAVLVLLVGVVVFVSQTPSASSDGLVGFLSRSVRSAGDAEGLDSGSGSSGSSSSGDGSGADEAGTPTDAGSGDGSQLVTQPSKRGTRHAEQADGTQADDKQARARMQAERAEAQAAAKGLLAKDTPPPFESGFALVESCLREDQACSSSSSATAPAAVASRVDARYTEACVPLLQSDRFRAATSADDAPDERSITCTWFRGGGIADNFVGCVSVFMIALVTRRRLYLHGWDDFLWLAHVAVPPPGRTDVPVFAMRFDWSPPDRVLDACNVTGLGLSRHLCQLQIIDSKPSNSFYERFLRNVQDDRKTPQHVLVTSNRGLTVLAFGMSEYASILRDELGLTPETAYGCLFNTLFPLNKAEVFREPVLRRLRARVSDPDLFTVALHIRMGDVSFPHPSELKVPKDVRDWELPPPDFALTTWLKCALNVYADRELGSDSQRPPRPLQVLLTTDSSAIRAGAPSALRRLQAYVQDAPLPNKQALLDALQTATLVQLSGALDHINAAVGVELSDEEDVLQRQRSVTATAVIENWLMSEADYFVTTLWSGFSNLVPFRALRPSNSTFALFHADSGRCATPTPYEDMAAIITFFRKGSRYVFTGWSGV